MCVNHRYQRGRRVLIENLSGNVAFSKTREQQQNGDADMDDDEEYEVPDLIEEIIGNQISSLNYE